MKKKKVDKLSRHEIEELILQSFVDLPKSSTMKTKETFKKEIEDFDNKLREHYKDDDLVTIDGIINLDLYYNSSPKILWILKEAYDEGYGYDEGGYYSEGKTYHDYINNFQSDKKLAPIWETIADINYGIYNKLNYIRIKYSYEDEQVFIALKKSAIINLKKVMNEESTSKDNEIKRNYEKNKEIIWKQISLINPDIIICGGTFKWLEVDIKNKAPFKTYPEYENTSFISENKLFIHAWHPSYPTLKSDENQGIYCDEIIETSISFLNRNDK